MLGIVIGDVVEGLTGFGIARQIGLGVLVDGYAACRSQFLPFCFLASRGIWLPAPLAPGPSQGNCCSVSRLPGKGIFIYPSKQPCNCHLGDH